MVDTYTVTIERTDDWTQSFNVYAALGRYPSESGDGILCGSVDISPSDTETYLSWTPTADGDWRFIAEPVRWGEVGPIGRIDPA